MIFCVQNKKCENTGIAGDVLTGRNYNLAQERKLFDRKQQII